MAANLKRKPAQDGGPSAKKTTGPWNMGLKESMKDPELKVDEDEKIVIIKDKYPKV